MTYNLVTKKLNNRAVQFNLANKVDFSSGNFIDETLKKLTQHAPFAKVVVLATEKSFVDSATHLITQLKKRSFRPTTVILEEQKRLSTEEVAKLFNLSEDVRAVIVTDNNLVEIGVYFATLKNAPIVFILNSFRINGILTNFLRVQNGNSVDIFNADCMRLIVLDDKLIDSDSVVDGIASVGGKISALVDYKINSALTGIEENSLLIENIEEAIDLLIEHNLLDKEKSKADVLYATFLVEFARCIDGGNFYNNSSAINCALAVCERTIETSTAEFFSSKHILDCYGRVFIEPQKGEKTVDYVLIAQKLSKLLCQDIMTISKDILYKLSILNENCGGTEQLKKAMKHTVLRAKKEFNAIERIYRACGGKKSYCPKKILEYEKVVGYVGKGINGMTLYSEWGF